MRKLIFIPVLFLFCLSCVHDKQKEESLIKTFKATGESYAATKTSMADNQVVWSADDSISVFNAACPGGLKFNINSSDGGKNEATFTCRDGNIGDGPWYALFPFSDLASYSKNTISFSLPHVQKLTNGSFGSDAYPMVAKTSSETLPFKNLCGLLHIQLKGSGNVKRVTITSARQEALWGSAKVNMDYSESPELVMTQTPDEEHRSITLESSYFNGLPLGEEEVNCYVVVPPGTLEGGFSITVSDGSGHEFSTQTSASITIVRSSLKHMAPLLCPLAGSKLLSCTEWGVYDLSGTEAVGIRVFNKEDQAALRSGLEMQFRIQSLVNANALIVSYPASMTEGQTYKLVLQSVGQTGVDDATVNALLLKKENGKCWLEDSANNVGYIIADKL